MLMKQILMTLKSNWTVWLPICISCISLVVSGLIFYFSHLKPFDLKILSSGRVGASKNPKLIRQAALLLDLLFINGGARQGLVEDIAVVVRFPSGRPLLIRSLFEMIDRTTWLTEQPLQPKAETFISFALKGGEKLVKRILFVPFDVGEDRVFVVGDYWVEVYARTDRYPDWKLYRRFPFAINQDDVHQLGRITATPQPDGRLYVNWFTQDKPTVDMDNEVEALMRRLQ